jgi:hypothetical protein
MMRKGLLAKLVRGPEFDSRGNEFQVGIKNIPCLSMRVRVITTVNYDSQ